jgi:hypothetical protein
MKFAVGNNGCMSARPFRRTFRKPVEQSLLQFQIRVPIVRNSHPAQRQRPSVLSHSDEQEIDRVIDHRPIHRRANLAAPIATDAFQNFSGNRLERIEGDQFLALQEPFESLDTRLDLNTLVRHSSGRFRQGDALAISDSNHQERQIFQVRFMKTRNKALHAHAELVSYFSQIHINSP